MLMHCFTNRPGSLISIKTQKAMGLIPGVGNFQSPLSAWNTLGMKMYYTEHVPKELEAASLAKQLRNHCALVGLFCTLA